MPALHPANSDKIAAVLIATVTTRVLPQRCAVSLPVIETAIPTSPARVNRIAGSGSQKGSLRTGNAVDQPGDRKGCRAGDTDTGGMPGDRARLRNSFQWIGNRLE